MAGDEELKARIRRQALECGFETAGFTDAGLPARHHERLNEYLELGRHGEMDWMETRVSQRTHPQTLWPEAQSVIMLGANYGPEADPLPALEEKSSGVISVYARNKDYHNILKKRLKRLARWLVEHEGGDVKVFIDTAPVMEKPLGAKAGIGWQGKHTNLVSRAFGSWLFIGAVFTTLKITPDDPGTDHCGRCSNCLDACPTNAFPAPYQLDARRCISYLTIEHKGPIPHEFRTAMGNRIYGCDDCLAVCPWNKFASAAQTAAFHARNELNSPALAELAALDDQAFRALFAGSPVKRTGRDRFVRNVAIAIGNSGDASLVAALRPLLADESPLVRGAAIWALARLDDALFETARQQNAPAETDRGVLEEWALGGADQASTVTST